MKNQSPKVVKMFGTNKFELILYEGPSGSYYIASQRGDNKPYVSEKIMDLITALKLFDIKLIEMEGN